MISRTSSLTKSEGNEFYPGEADLSSLMNSTFVPVDSMKEAFIRESLLAETQSYIPVAVYLSFPAGSSSLLRRR